MMMSVWLYRFKPGMTASTLEKLRLRGVDKVYPGVTAEGGTFLGRCWSHPSYTHGSVFRREDLAALRAEALDVDTLLGNLRLLSPAVASLEIRNMIPRYDPELVSLGDDEWHLQAVQPWIDAANDNPEVAYHLNVIGMSCLQYNTLVPYTVQAYWRDRFGQPQVFSGAPDPWAQPAAAPAAE